MVIRVQCEGRKESRCLYSRVVMQIVNTHVSAQSLCTQRTAIVLRSHVNGTAIVIKHIAANPPVSINEQSKGKSNIYYWSNPIAL